MAIKFNCCCGHTLSVPDNLAGKSGKCPKCKQTIKVPMPGGAAKAAASAKSPAAPAARPPQAARRPAAAQPAAVAASSNGMEALFDDLGLKQQSGPVCPSCGSGFKPGAVVCVKCGLNFATGEKALGFDAVRERPEFANQYLQEAADNMRRDMATDKRIANASMPWWVLMSYLIGALTLCAAGVVIVDGVVAEPAPEGTFVGKLQRMPVRVTLGATAGITGAAILLFAHLNICIFAFGRKALHGVGCFLLPILYSLPYGIANWSENKAPVKAIISSFVFLGGAAGLIIWGGGFGYITNLFQ